MKRTVLAAGLLAAFAMPAFADDVMIRNDESPRLTKAETTAVTPGRDDVTKSSVKSSGMYDGCLKRHQAEMM